MSNARELSQLPNQPGRKNLLFNGDMRIWQRSTSTAYSSGAQNGYLTADRWKTVRSNQSSITQAQSTDAPNGFANSFSLTVTTADGTLDAGNYEYNAQYLEGYDVQHLKWGTADAKPVTVSFWVKSSETGNFALTLYAAAGAGYNIGTVVTINAADTWEYKTITFPGLTTNSLANDNALRLGVQFVTTAGSTFNATDNTSWDVYSSGRLAYGQTLNLSGTLNATFKVTGFQLEVGEVATEFENRSYGEEFVSCCRYYQEMNLRTAVKGQGGVSGSGNTVSNLWTYIYPMRTQPTATSNSTAPAYYNAGWITAGSSAVIAPYQDYFAAGVSNVGIGAGTDFLWRWANGANMFVYFNAEL